MLGFVHGLGNTRHNITVLSGAPDETFRTYGFTAVNRKDMKAVQEAIDKCDALVYPGGSIFQDVTSFRSSVYYSHVVKMAKKARKKVMLLGQGVGPLTGFIGKNAASSAFNAADLVVVRDPGSVTTLKNIGYKGTPRVAADCAFLLPAPPESDATGFSVGNMKSVGISVRPHGKDKDVIKVFGELCRMLFQNGYMPVLIEMDKTDDFPLMQEISKAQGGKIPDIRKLSSPMQLQQRLARMDSVIAMRLHAGILAATVGIPPLMISYDPKVAAFAQMLDIGSAPSMEGITAQRIYDVFVEHLKSRERNVKVVERRVEDLRKQAMVNIDLFNSTLG